MEPLQDDVDRSNIVVFGHDKMRKQRLVGFFEYRWPPAQPTDLADDCIRSERRQQVHTAGPGSRCTFVGQIDDLSTAFAIDRGVRLFDETR
jgi:hypothetical protein